MVTFIKTACGQFSLRTLLLGLPVIILGGIDVTSNSVGAQTTTTLLRPRGAILLPEETPTSGTTRSTPKTELQLREEMKAAVRAKKRPAQTYDMNVVNAPPQLPGSVDDKSTDTTSSADQTTASFKPPRSSKEAILPPVGPPFGGNIYDEEGPGPIDNGQAENASPLNRTVGAAHAIACHPTDPNTVYVGFVNGGVWKTTNAYSSSPVWSAQTDGIGSFSIGDLNFDPTDPTNLTLIAGIGRFSSLAMVGGNRAGLLRTTDGGATWVALNGGGSMIGKNIAGVAARGPVIVAAVNIADSFTYANIGIFRSINNGASFTQISMQNGLPGGRAFDLAGDPTSLSTLYTAISDAGSANGVYKSTDTGFT